MSAQEALEAGLDGNVSSGGGCAILKAVVDFAGAGRNGDADAFAAIERW